MNLFRKKLKNSLFHQVVSFFAIFALATEMFTPQITKAEYLSKTVVNSTPSMVMVTISTSSTPVLSAEEEMRFWVLEKIQEAGLSPEEAEVIIKCESRWNPDAMGINKNRTADLGLWQINSIHKDISNADKLDYKKATEWAIQKRLKDGHWRAWMCSRKLARR